MLRGIQESRKKNPDLEIILENISGFIYFQAVTAKFITAIQTENKLKYVYKEIMKDWMQLTDKNELNILHEFADVGRKLAIIWMAYIIITAIGFTTLPTLIPMFLNVIIKRNETFKKSLCIYCEYFIDQEKYFFFLFFHQLFAGVITTLMALGVDTSYVNCVQHVLALFNIVRLKVAFDTISFYSKVKDFDLKTLENRVHTCVIRSIQIHQRTLEFVDTIQSAFNVVFLILFILLVFGISTITVDLVWNLQNPIQFVRIGVLWLGVILYMFYTNWPGQKLTDESEELFNSIYTCGWYKFPAKTRILIRFMHLRCRNPCRLTAGSLLDINFLTCSRILKSAMSYFTVLTAMR